MRIVLCILKIERQINYLQVVMLIFRGHYAEIYARLCACCASPDNHWHFIDEKMREDHQQILEIMVDAVDAVDVIDTS